jgi:pimeloyl-ACP methyl ester carboxylesterase
VLEDPPFQTMGTRIAGSAWEAQFRAMREIGLRGGSIESLAEALAAIELPRPDGGRVRLGDLRDAKALRWSAACLADLDPEVLTPVIAGRWLDGYDPATVAARIQCPVRLLQADPLAGGALADDERDAFAAATRRCTVERFTGTGHLLHWMLPERVAAAVAALAAESHEADDDGETNDTCTTATERRR